MAPFHTMDSQMLTGRRLGVYHVQERIGAGGMGEVYRARDTRLGRDVAIKILPAVFTSDPERLARFEREARVLASLNHPNIATIHGVEEGDGVQALVMELVDGETLAERIARGPLRVADALAIATQIADALEAAHEKGIVHRDLKPANIKITPAGTVKVLDFGLAKAAEGDAASPDLTQSPTISAIGTRAGVILGTAAYMSPEQARGLAVDKRTDIWAFGCVLYEMLTGRAAFAGATITDTIAAILEREPDWTRVASASAPLRRLLRRCLEKDSRHRLRDIADARLDLQEAAGSSPERTTPIADGRQGWRIATRLAAVVCVLAAGAVLGWVLRSRAAIAPTTADAADSSTVLAPITTDEGLTADPSLSTDGALLAYASDRAGRSDLDIWIQTTAGGRPIQVTSEPVDEREPALSPDGSRLAFRSERDGGGIYIVPAFGGAAPRLLVAGGRRPKFSPDGRFVAYWTGSNIGFSVAPGSYRTFIVAVDSGVPQEVGRAMPASRFPGMVSRRPVAPRRGQPRRACHSGSVGLVCPAARRRGSGPDRGLRAAAAPRNRACQGALDQPRQLAGLARPVFRPRAHLVASAGPCGPRGRRPPERLTFGTTREAQPSAGPDGTVAFSSLILSNNVWSLPLDRNRGVVTGPATRLTSASRYTARASASSDGRLMTYLSALGLTLAQDVVLHDLSTGTVTDVGVRSDPFGPGLSPDGRWVAYQTATGGVEVVPSRGGPARTICRECGIGDWTSDSAAILVTTGSALKSIDIKTGASQRPGHRGGVEPAFPDPRPSRPGVPPERKGKRPAFHGRRIGGANTGEAMDTAWSGGTGYACVRMVAG